MMRALYALSLAMIGLLLIHMAVFVYVEQSCSGFHHIIYGDFKEWYMWSPRSMQATCFDFSYGRHMLAMDRLRDMGGNLSRLPRFQRECLHADLAGP